MTETKGYTGRGLSKREFAAHLDQVWRETYLFYPLPNPLTKETIMTTQEQTTPAEAIQQRDDYKAEAYLLPHGDMTLIATCLIGFKWLLDWATEMVDWIEANTDLDVPVQQSEFGLISKTNREWVSDTKAKLADHTSWYMAAKDIKRTAAPSSDSQQGPLPHLKLAAMTPTIPQDKEAD